MTVGEAFGGDAAIYDRSRRQLVPCFDDFYGRALREARSAFARDAAIDVVDLGAGTGLMTALFADAFPNARFTLADIAPEMLERARARLGDDARFRYHVGDSALWQFDAGCDLVISALSVHHLEHADKRALFGRIHDALRGGGLFVNADQVRGPTPRRDRQYRDAWRSAAIGAGVSDADLAAAEERMTHDITATPEEQLAWLRAAGFDDVDCVYRWYMFAVISAR